MADPLGAMTGLFDGLGPALDEERVRAAAGMVPADSLGKHRAMPARPVREASRVRGPTLAAFGYAAGPVPAGRFPRIFSRLRAF